MTYKLILDLDEEDGEFYIVNHSSGKSMYLDIDGPRKTDLEWELYHWNMGEEHLEDLEYRPSIMQLIRDTVGGSLKGIKLIKLAEFDSFEELYSYFCTLQLINS